MANCESTCKDVFNDDEESSVEIRNNRAANKNNLKSNNTSLNTNA